MALLCVIAALVAGTTLTVRARNDSVGQPDAKPNFAAIWAWMILFAAAAVSVIFLVAIVVGM